jgi:hypothetical protein
MMDLTSSRASRSPRDKRRPRACKSNALPHTSMVSRRARRPAAGGMPARPAPAALRFTHTSCGFGGSRNRLNDIAPPAQRQNRAVRGLASASPTPGQRWRHPRLPWRARRGGRNAAVPPVTSAIFPDSSFMLCSSPCDNRPMCHSSSFAWRLSATESGRCVHQKVLNTHGGGSCRASHYRDRRVSQRRTRCAVLRKMAAPGSAFTAARVPGCRRRAPL